MAGKQRFRGPEGAIFVPNVPEDTIAFQVAAGIWSPVEVEKAAEPEAPVKRSKK